MSPVCNWCDKAIWECKCSQPKTPPQKEVLWCLKTTDTRPQFLYFYAPKEWSRATACRAAAKIFKDDLKQMGKYDLSAIIATVYPVPSATLALAAKENAL